MTATNSTGVTHLRFGIRELDRLINRGLTGGPEGRDYGGIVLPGAEDSGSCTSVCIAGPDGAGKSILALHLAADYRAATSATSPTTKVIYLSTDLSYGSANGTWFDFGLDRPVERWRGLPRFTKRDLASAEQLPSELREFSALGANDLTLEQYQPIDEEKRLPKYLVADEASRRFEVAFIDAQHHTTGDDWLFLQRLLSAVPDPAPGAPPHLLIIDAVEGLELLAGGRDSFGEQREGRARITQLIRTAQVKFNIVYVVEEPRPGERLDTQYVTDVVVRLRSEQSPSGDYNRRTVEIEKARGHQHVRGKHEIVIRSGAPMKTGVYQNPDDPEVRMSRRLHDASDARRGRKYLAYVHVLRSLHSLSRQILSDTGHNPPVTESGRSVFGFGIHYLDRLLHPAAAANGERLSDATSADEEATSNSAPTAGGAARREAAPPRGLKGGSVTALIGPMTTYKSGLSRAFLASAVRPRLEGREAKPNELKVAVLITTRAMDADGLLHCLLRHCGVDALKKSPESRLLKWLQCQEQTGWPRRVRPP